jgi:hypothetical protein
MVYFQELDFEVELQFSPKEQESEQKLAADEMSAILLFYDTRWRSLHHIVTRKLWYLAGVRGAPTLRLHVALVLCRLKKSIHELLRHAFKRVSGRGARSFIGEVAARCSHWEQGRVALHVLLCAAMIRVRMR